jgi:hypothetical protein
MGSRNINSEMKHFSDARYRYARKNTDTRSLGPVLNDIESPRDSHQKGSSPFNKKNAQ